MTGPVTGVGRLIGIAVRPLRRAPLIAIDAGDISATSGLEGDHAGKRAKRLVTILAREDWEAACAALTPPADPVHDLPWTTRRANLLVEGVRLPRAEGAVLAIGSVVLEITGQTYPCSRMEEARPGLLKALAQEWRGGVLCAVIRPGRVAVGDAVSIVSAPEERTRILP